MAIRKIYFQNVATKQSVHFPALIYDYCTITRSPLNFEPSDLHSKVQAQKGKMQKINISNRLAQFNSSDFEKEEANLDASSHYESE